MNDTISKHHTLLTRRNMLPKSSNAILQSVHLQNIENNQNRPCAKQTRTN